MTIIVSFRLDENWVAPTPIFVIRPRIRVVAVDNVNRPSYEGAASSVVTPLAIATAPPEMLWK